MNPEGNKAMIFELVDTLLKSWWTVVAGLCLGAACALLALQFMPEKFEAITKLRIAPQSIPEAFVKSTVTDDMSQRLLEIQEAVLSRAYMDTLIEQNFEKPADEEGRDRLLRTIRQNLDVYHPRETRLAYLKYEDDDAQRAADVVNHITRLYVEQNKEFRSNQATNTKETFERMAAEAKKELDAIEQELSQFNTINRFQTDKFLDANLQLIEARRDDLESNQRDQSASRLRLQDLRDELKSGAGELELPNGTIVSPRLRRIKDLRRELKGLRVDYSETHPAVVKKQRELDDLLASDSVSEEGLEIDDPVDPELAALQNQIQSVERELTKLQSEEDSLRREIADYERRIRRTPEIQAQLSNMEEQRRVLDERYRDLKEKAEDARGSEFLEDTEQGQRIEVLQWAGVPFRPVAPDPMRIYMVGLVAGCLLFIGPLLARAFLNPLVASEAGLKALVAVPVLVSIPRFPTEDNRGVGRRRFLKNFALSLVSAAALTAVFVAFKFNS